MEKLGYVPKDGLDDLPGFSYIMQSSDVGTNRVCGNEGSIERRQGGVDMETFREIELRKPARVYVEDVSKGDLFLFPGPEIIKDRQIEAQSNEEGNGAVADEVGGCIEGESEES
jgi:hypothetical protein